MIKSCFFHVSGKLHWSNSKQIDCWHNHDVLHQSNPIAHTVSFLMLLPSGPDMVRRAILYKTLISTCIETTQHNQICPSVCRSASL